MFPKWSAIKSVLTEFRISPNEVAAIGDGPNDIEMLRHVGTGVAMGNACERVKAAADFVTGHHENDGLAEFIERYLLKSFAIKRIFIVTFRNKKGVFQYQSFF